MVRYKHRRRSVVRGHSPALSVGLQEGSDARARAVRLSTCVASLPTQRDRERSANLVLFLRPRAFSGATSMELHRFVELLQNCSASALFSDCTAKRRQASKESTRHEALRRLNGKPDTK